jgi:hypothetical protein
MKKYLITSAAALALCGLITSCTHELDYEASVQSSVVKKYEDAFITAFGKPDPNQEWGFGSSTAANTRSYTIPGTNDTYEAFNYPSTEEINSKFPGSVPEGAEEIATNGDYNYYYNHGAGYNYKITAEGEYNIGGSWMNTGWVSDPNYQNGGYTAVYYYNVYINVDGNVTLKRQGDAHFNIYIIKGNVTLDSNFGEMSGTISIAAGATLNDNRDHIASNYGVEVFNNGTVNVGAYKIGNNAKIFNMKRFIATGDVEYNSGAGNTSYFYNVGDDVVLEAASMTLNSTCNFISDGTVTITGETFVTKDGIYWVNNGHYTTGSMKFSAHNGTFYNYCQLLVTNCCIFTDGHFNMMDNSYAEFGTGLFNNFHVNMGNNAGFNVKNGTKWGQQGAGILQGFYANSDATTAYVRLGGENSVPAHKGSAFHVSGANLTLAYQNMTFYQNFTFNANSYDGTTYSQVRTDEQPESNLANFHNVTNIITGDDFAKTGFTLRDGECAATWKGKDPDPSSGTVRVICEDLSVTQASDWDFNDVVFDVQLADNNTKVKVTLLAAGGTLPLIVGDMDHEVHELFAAANPDKNISTSSMINTGSTGEKYTFINCKEATFYLDVKSEWFNDAGTGDDALVKAVAKNMPVQVYKLENETKTWVTMECKKGEPAAKIAVGQDYNWCDERTDIRDKFKSTYANGQYSNFTLYVKGIIGDGWYNNTSINQEQADRY